MDKYPGYKGGGLWDLDLDQPLAWLPAEVARLSAPQYDLSCNSFGSGLATTQQLQSSFCGVDSQSLGGPCNSVDVNQAWEDVKQGVTGVQDQASNNRPMILHDGPSLKQELELDFGSKCTPWEHPLYEDKDHGEFIPEAKKYLGSNDWDVSYPASSPSLLESSQSLKKKMSGTKFCGFCKSNGAMAKNFLSHPLRNDYGKLVCPVLRSYTCPNCGATGDTAHTSSYCPSKRQPHNSLPLAVKLKNTMRNASSVRRFNR
ncbi:uncharacterized protein LOC122255497 isoform X2 [Penaeus japonicus]|uniref:uncharacterized protein LOC122255497 isoform X2 n=1 Tax=Penaeus japonicus TaxID=27405 RepID=UPI001C70BC79|nr:uncharacterized protein LOC122255497 isoform X2 [Penaeus japonicus]